MPPPLLKELERRLGLPSLVDVTSLLSGDSGKRIDSILTKLEKLSSNQDALKEAVTLLQLVKELGQTGDLAHLDSILKNIPKGKTGQNMLIEVRHLISEISDKLDKVSNLATTILKSEE